jgi:outer membrane receptor protein involved in Fe transport
VIRSPFELAALRRLTFSVDWYKIDIEGAIAIPTHLTVYQQCMDAQFNSYVADPARSGEEIANNNPYCALIRREYIAGTSNVYGADRRFLASYVNLGGIKTSGVDVQLDWGSELASLGLGSVPGGISANIQYSHLDSYKISPFPGGAFAENKDSGVNFVNRLFTTLGYNVGRGSVGLRWQHLPSLEAAPGSADAIQGVNAHDQFDLFGRWQFSERVDLRFGIDNLFNADPEVIGAVRDEANPSGSNHALGSSFSQNDTFGRRFYIGAKMTL